MSPSLIDSVLMQSIFLLYTGEPARWNEEWKGEMGGPGQGIQACRYPRQGYVFPVFPVFGLILQ